MSTINVEEIMDGIRKDIKEKGYKAEDLRFVDITAEGKSKLSAEVFSFEDARRELDYLNFHYNNPIFFPLAGNPIKVFIQKVIRKLVVFVLAPPFRHQNRLNASIARFQNQTIYYMEENEGLKEMIQSQQEQIEALQKAVKELQEKK